MFGLPYVQHSPSSYVIQYRNGQPVREGAGLAISLPMLALKVFEVVARS